MADPLDGMTFSPTPFLTLTGDLLQPGPLFASHPRPPSLQLCGGDSVEQTIRAVHWSCQTLTQRLSTLNENTVLALNYDTRYNELTHFLRSP